MGPMLNPDNTYVQKWSGGKDSTCSIVIENIHRDKLGIPPSTIVMAEVMFDKKRGISAELPDHIEWVYTKAKPILESFGHKVEIKQSEKDYLDCFFHVVQKPKKRMEYAGKMEGFPIGRACAIQSRCKVSTIRQIEKEYLSGAKTVSILGIAADEPKRHGQLNEKKISLLKEFGICEYQTYDILKPYGLVSPLYTHAKRNGCWFCPNQRYSQLAWVKEHYPEYWEMLRELSYVEGTVSKGFKWGIPFDEVDKKVDVYMTLPEQLSIFDYKEEA